MNPHAVTVSSSPKSGKELAKVKYPDKTGQDGAITNARVAASTAGFGKGTSKYWEGKVFRPVWRDENGERRQVSHYFVRIMVSARREAIALNTADRIEAGRRAARLYERIRTVGWDTALRDFDPERHAPKSALTVGDVITAMSRGDLRARTRINYARALRWFAARLLGFEATKMTFGPEGSKGYRQQVEAVLLTALNDAAVDAILKRHIASAGGDVVAARSARISAASFVRNAKAGLKAAEKEGITLSEPKPFYQVKKPEGAISPAYTSIIDAGKLLRAAKKELANDPSVYMALLLALGAGLRRGEIQNLRWRQVDRQRNRILVLAHGGWAPKTGESEQAVHVNTVLLDELEPLRKDPDDLVTTPGALDLAVNWLRKFGVDTPKPLHSLRKEFGSLVADASDLFTASRQLRHSSLAVTASIYVENRKRVAPDIGMMLKP